MPAVQARLARPGSSLLVLLAALQLREASIAMETERIGSYLFVVSREHLCSVVVNQAHLLHGYEALANVQPDRPHERCRNIRKTPR